MGKSVRRVLKKPQKAEGGVDRINKKQGDRFVSEKKIDCYGHITIHSMAFNFGAIGFGDDSNLHQLSSL
ncbi:hypothetical protein V6N13_009061 [Hibiscus sabdariffa]|uniref:Uncharacterized protein n=1 Tax=Hibiscus sabdariffa TaxID=183260 RepID=A0ABR2NGH0_9ROSI